MFTHIADNNEILSGKPYIVGTRLFNAVNIEFGYKPLQIFSPREVTTYGREEN